MKLHLVIVCHTELFFDGTWGCYDFIQPRFERMLDTVCERTGKRPKVTYCLTSEFLSERLDDAFRFVEQGNEIGIHSHLPGSHRPKHTYQGRYAYSFNNHGILNQDMVAGALRQVAISLGLPGPKSHVSGMFTFQRTTIGTLEDAGFTVDCSLLPGIKGTHEASGDFVLADNTRRKSPYPYRPSRADPWIEGSSGLVELPVSGNLGSFGIDHETTAISKRLDDSRPFDVYQTYWHHFEFGNPQWPDDPFKGATDFLTYCANQKQLVFSTAAEAASDFVLLGYALDSTKHNL